MDLPQSSKSCWSTLRLPGLWPLSSRQVKAGFVLLVSRFSFLHVFPRTTQIQTLQHPSFGVSALYECISFMVYFLVKRKCPIVPTVRRFHCAPVAAFVPVLLFTKVMLVIYALLVSKCFRRCSKMKTGKRGSGAERSSPMSHDYTRQTH